MHSTHLLDVGIHIRTAFIPEAKDPLFGRVAEWCGSKVLTEPAGNRAGHVTELARSTTVDTYYCVHRLAWHNLPVIQHCLRTRGWLRQVAALVAAACLTVIV